MKILKTILFVTILTVSMTSFTMQDFNDKSKKTSKEIQIDNSSVVSDKGGFVNEADGPN